MSSLDEPSDSSLKSTELETGSGDARKTPSKANKNQDTNSSSLVVSAVHVPSPLRFIPGASKYIFTLRSSGYTAASALDSLRRLIMIRLGGIVEVPLTYMFEHSLPCRDDIVPLTKTVKDSCVAENVIVGDRWSGFEEDPATRHKRGGQRNSENKIYTDFGKLWNKIARIARTHLPKLPNGKCPQATIRFRSVFNTNGMGERESECIKPDAILELVKSSMIKYYAERVRNAKRYCICDAACPVEVKPVVNEANRIDNLQKITFNANRYFVDDLRRRAVYGVEVQNRDLRVLTYTRTGVIASEHFDWIKDQEHFIRVIISLTFASEEELGYDPYIRRIEVNPDDTALALSAESKPDEDPALDEESIRAEYARNEDPIPDEDVEGVEDTEDTEDTVDAEDTEDAEDAEDAKDVEDPISTEEPHLRRSERLKNEKAKEEEEEETKEKEMEENQAHKKRKMDIDEEIAYEIDVSGRTFITVGPCISDCKADFFVGRATQVFQAYEKGDAKKTLYVLKVTNVSGSVAEQNRLEGKIIADINAKSRELHCETYFPTLECYAFPQIIRPEQEERLDTSTLFLWDNVVEKGFYPGVIAVRTLGECTSSSSRTAGSNRSQSRGEIYTPSLPSVTGLPSNVQTSVSEFLKTCFPRRYQYRLVTREVGSPITSLRNLSHIFHALEQVSHALKWLHIMGYLHRDLSLGNILYMWLHARDTTPENRGMRVILNDYDSSKRHDVLVSGKFVRTGTAEFLSSELLQELYLHKSILTRRQLTSISSGPEQAEEVPAIENLEQPLTTAVLKPHPNFLHETESLIWIIFYFLCSYVPEGYNTSTLATPDQKHAQWVTGYSLFWKPHDAQSLSSRLSCFSQEDIFRTYFNTLPPPFQPLYPNLNELRRHILKEYIDRESSPSFKGPVSFKGCIGEPSYYEGISECFRGCRVLADEKKLFKMDLFVPKADDIIVEREVREDVDVKFDPNKSAVLQEPGDTDDSTTDVFGPLR